APTMAEVLRNRAQERDRAMIVGGALDAIRVHTADSPARLPDPHEYVPAPRGHRAPRGGKRAARRPARRAAAGPRRNRRGPSACRAGEPQARAWIASWMLSVRFADSTCRFSTILFL